MSAPPLIFDRKLLRARLDRAAPTYAGADFLKSRAAEDAVVRLEAILREFPIAVDLGARNGAFAAALKLSDAASRVGLLIETDLSGAMLAGRAGPRLVADEEQLPFGFGKLDLVVSTLALHWTNDLPGSLIQIRRALRPDGLFLASIFGGATLHYFALALTIGILFGIYSSVFVAAAIAMWLGIAREDLIKSPAKKDEDPNDPNAGATV